MVRVISDTSTMYSPAQTQQAVSFVSSQLASHGVGDGRRIYVTHDDTQEKADLAKEMRTEAFPGATVEVCPLTPVFITQGGPGCVAIQVIKDKA